MARNAESSECHLPSSAKNASIFRLSSSMSSSPVCANGNGPTATRSPVRNLPFPVFPLGLRSVTELAFQLCRLALRQAHVEGDGPVFLVLALVDHGVLVDPGDQRQLVGRNLERRFSEYAGQAPGDFRHQRIDTLTGDGGDRHD